MAAKRGRTITTFGAFLSPVGLSGGAVPAAAAVIDIIERTVYEITARLSTENGDKLVMALDNTVAARFPLTFPIKFTQLDWFFGSDEEDKLITTHGAKQVKEI